jgi:hypothetical protein
VRATPLALIPAVLLVPAMADARDLRGRVGLGFQNQFSELLSISAKFGLPADRETVNVQAQVLVGFALGTKADERFFAGGRILFPFVAEDNLNLYGAVGGGWLRRADDDQLVRVQATVGAEFFLFGLENLGLSAEFGAKVDVAPPDVEVGTTSGTMAGVGVHYYFGAPGAKRK